MAGSSMRARYDREDCVGHGNYYGCGMALDTLLDKYEGILGRGSLHHLSSMLSNMVQTVSKARRSARVVHRVVDRHIRRMDIWVVI